ncbi:MAG: hypothetical protein GX119_07405 [Syntrophomonadaceae bacterium]|jgi:hypothetical protein|nr:hypothetical protein [Syntrophomonadaceae bacterium]
MFFTFLNKDKAHYPDLSLLLQYTPEEVLFYYYNSHLSISLQTYQQLKAETQSEEDALAPCCQWMELLEDELGLNKDLDTLLNNEYIHIVGPYYYPFSNTRFYFSKNTPPDIQQISSGDFGAIMALEFLEPINKEMLEYHKGRKSSKKNHKNKEELIKDINMCIISLHDTEKVNKHINYLNKLLELRNGIVNIENLWPQEPDILPTKPKKEEASPSPGSNLIPFASLKARRKRKSHEEEHNSFNQQMKIYLMQYREYEKACDRYKEVLEQWQDYSSDFLERCYVDIEITESKLKNAQKNLRIYNNIISKSLVHADYQDINTLSVFKHYLETGRANDLQDCMNLYEEERHWDEIKASQERIENTIYFLQNSDDKSRLAQDHIERLLKKINDRSAESIRV